MSYLLTQIFLYMLVTLVLGLFLGRMIWSNADATGALEAERDRLKTDLAKERDAAAALRGETASLKSALEKAKDAATAATSGDKPAKA
ncbi:MAG: hypothetical protein AAFV62_08080 [Pseudomonadota bacterium]